ncbi:hypothetical protein QM565_28835 [Geitlerinema splendidum]|nr:hypothetical protein [Geitlerinema splendidum]
MNLSCWNEELEECVRRWAEVWGRRLGIRREDREDLAQEAVCKVLLAMDSGKLYGEDVLWVVVRNCALDFKRDMPRRTAPLSDRDAGGMVPSVDSVALEEIEADFPEVVALARAREAGFEWEVIAAEVGMTVTQIRQRWRRLVAQVAANFSAEIVRDLSHRRG